MHIDQLIIDIKRSIPFKTKEDAQIFIDGYDYNHRIAFISAMYFGKQHLYRDTVSDEFYTLFTGEEDRLWEKTSVMDNDIAGILYGESEHLTVYYDAFLRCTTNSNYNRDNY